MRVEMNGGWNAGDKAMNDFGAAQLLPAAVVHVANVDGALRAAEKIRQLGGQREASAKSGGKRAFDCARRAPILTVL